MSINSFNSDLLKLDLAKEAQRIGAMLIETVLRRFRKKGLVVAMSGGIDSSLG
jgi:NAD+ synthase